MTMEFRQAREQDLGKIVQVGLLAFPTTTPDQRLRNLTKNPRHTLADVFVAEDAGEIQGTFVLFPLLQRLRGADLAMGGLASVAVAPHCRRRGVARVMMRGLLAELLRRGNPISVLYPFRHEFYARYGWGLAGVTHEYIFAPSSLPPFNEARRVEPCPPDNAGMLADYYQAVWRRRNGMIQRTAEYWQSLLGGRTKNLYIFRDNHGSIQGHMSYLFAPTHDDLLHDIQIQEICALTGEAWRGLLGFIAAQREQIRAAHVFLPPDEPLHALLNDPRSPDYQTLSCGHYSAGRMGAAWMLRVTDIDLFFACPMQFSGPDANVYIEVADPGAQDGAAICRMLRFRGGRVTQCQETAPGSGKADAVLRCGMTPFSQIAAGALSPSRAVFYGLASADPPDSVDLLDRIFRTPPPFISVLDDF